MNQFIEAADIREFWPISKNIEASRINPWIIRAQNTMLQPLLSPELYLALDTAFPDILTDDRFDKLMNGDDYKYASNFDRRFPGIRELLAAYAYSLIIDNDSTFVTRGGVVSKNTEQSTPTEKETVAYKSNDSYSDAIRLEGEFYNYMSQKQSVYPEFVSTIPNKNSSFNFFNASRPKRGRIRYGY